MVILVVDITQRPSPIEPKKSDATSADSTYLFEFDPNTAELHELRRLGLSKRVAVSIIRYREAGKVFRIKEDLYECYNISDSVYYTLEPYIKIGQEYQYKKRNTTTPTHKERTPTPLSPFLLDTVSVEYLRTTGVLSRRQAEVFVRWHATSQMRDMENIRECYVISEEAATQLEPYIIFPIKEEPTSKLVDINRADSAELRGVIGIGEKSVVEIIEYRKKLGGFYSIYQLSQINCITESNFERIIKQISCDSCDISKIDVNFAVAKNLIEHPYLTNKSVRRLCSQRQIKGGWSSIEELIEDKIFTKEEAARLRPYLRFEPYTKQE